MPGLPTLVVEDNTGTERFTLDCITAERTDSLIEMWTARARVDRAEWLATAAGTFDEVNDRFRIERGDATTLFEGRFRTDERDENTVIVYIDSYERDAVDAQPTDGLELFENVTDDTVFSDAIGDIPTLSAGTVETGASGLSFSFANAERSKQIRDAAEPFGMDLRYDFDRTVDFVERLGTDKPGVSISSTNQSIVDTLSVQDTSRDPVTHLRGLGAQQGDDQVSAEATIGSYSPGDRQVWREYTNKDIVNESRLSEIVNRLITEYNDNRRRLKVEAGLVGVDVSLGDAITVDLPEDGINQLLRIVRLTERIDTEEKLVATLTNRTPERGGARKRRDDLERFNNGYEGFIDRDTDSYGWQPVTSSVNATRPYPYPSDVVSERLAEVVVNSIPYRAYSSGGASGGGSTESAGIQQGQAFNVIDSAENGSDVTVSPGSETSISSTVPSGFSGYMGYVVVDLMERNTVPEFEYRYDGGSETFVQQALEYNEQNQYDTVIADPSIEKSDTYTLTVRNPSGNTADQSYLAGDIRMEFIEPDHDHEVILPNHTHPAEPGLTEFASETVTGADLIVNGTTVATNIGTGEFTTTVDIGGELNPGDNTIELASDTLGLVNLTVQTQLFRQGSP